MSAPDVIEVVRSRTVLGVAFHDLLTDARIVDGLRVTAWPEDGGRVTPAFQTASGAYGFRGLDGMAHVERPAYDAAADDPDGDLAGVATRAFVVQVVDPRDRYLDTVLLAPVPTMGLITQGDVLETPDGGAHDDLPIYLFPAPARPVPKHVAAVRAQVADHDSGEPVPWCRIDVVVDPDGQARRSTGLADSDGNVLVTVPYPRFGPPEGAAGPTAPGEEELPAPGTQGTPWVERTWPVTVTVRASTEPLQPPAGARVPALDRVLGQPSTDLWASTVGPPAPSLSTELEHGIDLVLRTDGDPGSRLLIGGPSS